MTNTSDTRTTEAATVEDQAAATQLPPERLDEIRDVLARLLAARPADSETRALLADARQALAEVLNERDALVAANAKAGEELALWTGDVR
jgi:hypothetical protein